MADVQREFTSYKVYYFSGGSTADRPAAAEIDCFDATSTRVGSIFFYSYDALQPLIRIHSKAVREWIDRRLKELLAN